jgi:hypothetical protein
MHAIKDDLVVVLRRYAKRLADVIYVSYKVYNHGETKLNEYFCSIDEFMVATKLASCPFDFSFMCDICYVGHDWWLEYDYQGLLNMHLIPTKPLQHKAPMQNDILSLE